MIDHLEHQLVSGYDAKGFVFPRPWNGMSPSELAALTFGTWEECLAKGGWVQFTLLKKSGARRDFPGQLKDSLSVALSMFSSPVPFQVPGYRVGFGAWETWIREVKNGKGTEHGPWWNGMVWSEWRLMAADFFREIDAALPPRARKTAAELAVVYGAPAGDMPCPGEAGRRFAGGAGTARVDRPAQLDAGVFPGR